MAINALPRSLTKLPHKSHAEPQKEFVEELKNQWKLLWNERFNDKIRAEGISVKDYAILSVERGTIIHATRDFKALNFREILQRHMVEEHERFIQPDPNTGGWNKFIKKQITSNKPKRSYAITYTAENFSNKRAMQQAKKGGRGWLHFIEKARNPQLPTEPQFRKNT